MFEVDRVFYKLSGLNKDEVERLTSLMLGVNIEAKQNNKFYYIELFLEIVEINVPRHLIIGDLTLILMEFSRMEYFGLTYVYNDGLIEVEHDYFAYITLMNNKLVSYTDFVINYFSERFSKEFNDSLNSIKGSKLYYSIINEAHNSFTQLKWRREVNVVMNRNFELYHSKFKLAKDLTVHEFENLFI